MRNCSAKTSDQAHSFFNLHESAAQEFIAIVVCLSPIARIASLGSCNFPPVDLWL